MKNFETYMTRGGWELKHWNGLVSARQVALALGYTHSYQAINLGIPHLKRGDRCVFRLQDVIDYIERNTQKVG